MRIVIETVDHRAQRYDTVGDWQMDVNSAAANGCDLLIRVSRMDDWRSEALVAVHELVEALLCKQAGITQEAVDRWDMGPGMTDSEPGDCPAAPYYREHKAAEIIERLLAMWLFLNWPAHETACEATRDRGR